MEIVKLRGNAQNGSFLAGLGACYYGGLQTSMPSLKQGHTHCYGFTVSFALHLRKTGDHEGGESMWAVCTVKWLVPSCITMERHRSLMQLSIIVSAKNWDLKKINLSIKKDFLGFCNVSTSGGKNNAPPSPKMPMS